MIILSLKKRLRRLSKMSLNFITFVICTITAIWQGINGHLGFLLLNITFALLNLPFAIKWLIDYFK